MNNLLTLSESLISEYLEEAKVDAVGVGLWEIISDARKEFGLEDAIQIQQVVIDAVNRLLAHNIVAISYCGKEKAYEVWDMEPARSIKRLEQEWGKLGRIPNMGDGISFIDKEKLPLMKIIPKS